MEALRLSSAISLSNHSSAAMRSMRHRCCATGCS